LCRSITSNNSGEELSEVFTNNLILKNAALFLIGIVGLILILNNSLLHKKIRISDEIMIALAISSFLF